MAGLIDGAATVHIGEVFEWDAASESMTRYYYAGAQRSPTCWRAIRTGSASPVWLLGDHLGSTSVAADADGSLLSRQGYLPWGELRFADGSLPGRYQFTGQASYEAEFGLYFFKARWYDPHLGRFSQPDSIVPSIGKGSNPNAIDCTSTNSYLTVNYLEPKLLEKLNSSNKAMLQASGFSIAPLPPNSVAFDRYAYSLNNPMRYTDPTGHCPFCVPMAMPLAAITPVGWVVIGAVAIGVGLNFTVPDVREAMTNGMYEAGEAASNGLNALFARGKYVPPGLSEKERNAYREAVHAYKRAWGLKPNEDVPKEILDDIADLIKEGLKPGDAVDAVDGPPESD